MTGRRQDAIWQHFTKIKENGKLRAECKHCKKQMCSLVARMKTHIHKCESINTEINNSEVDETEYNDSERQDCKYIYVYAKSTL